MTFHFTKLSPFKLQKGEAGGLFEIPSNTLPAIICRSKEKRILEHRSHRVKSIKLSYMPIYTSYCRKQKD